MEFINAIFSSSWLLCTLLFVGLAAILFLPFGQKDKKESAWEVLHKKFAEGALSVAEFEERKAILGRNDRRKK